MLLEDYRCCNDLSEYLRVSKLGNDLSLNRYNDLFIF